jgi:flagellar hook-length control protein FliK
METIALTLAPSSPSPSGGQTSKSRTGDDNTFAPALSEAVAKKNTSDGAPSEKSARKIPSAKQEDTTEEIIPPESTGPENGKITVTTKDTSSASQADKTVENPSTDTASEVDTTSKTDIPDTPPFLFAIGISEDLFTPSKTVPVTDLEITINPQSAAQSIKTEAGFDITKNILQDTPLKQTPQNNSGGQLNFFSEVSDIIPAAEQDTTNITQSVNGNGQDTLLAQLQKILTANGADKAVYVQQLGSQDKTAGPESLFPPLYTLTDTSSQPTTTITDISNDSLTAALSGFPLDKVLTGEKRTDRISSTPERDFHLFLSKADTQGEKDSAKIQEKDATLQDTTKQQQTALFNSMSSTDTAGNSLQAGQFSFGNTLAQNLQTGQHLTGTTGSNYLPPWTSFQENSLINQVTQHFQINSGSSTSKLTLKLYPEELGELKIDIQLKDGSIKANIVTQNEQVQQVLEKYIPKLRSFMEQQGLTVDDILVTNSSGDVGKHDLFQEDFVNNHNFSSPENSGRSTSFADLLFEKDLAENSGTTSGVNVTV